MIDARKLVDGDGKIDYSVLVVGWRLFVVL